MRLILLLTGAVLAAPAAAADRFDLSCTGVRKSIFPAAATSSEEPFATELRVDLVAMKYCFGDCRRTADIYRVDPQTITFDDPYRDDPVKGSGGHSVNRVTGGYSLYSSRPGPNGVSTFVNGTCEVTPFKGFGGPPTKF